jgi:hypothetical protein
MNRRRPHPALSLVLLLIPLTAAATEEPTPTPTPTPTPVFRDEVTVSETPILDSNRVDEFGIAHRHGDGRPDRRPQRPGPFGRTSTRARCRGLSLQPHRGLRRRRRRRDLHPRSWLRPTRQRDRHLHRRCAAIRRGVAHPLLDPLTLDTTDRIDVHRSAQPVLYGNMAFGAVNMISNGAPMPGSAVDSSAVGVNTRPWSDGWRPGDVTRVSTGTSPPATGPRTAIATTPTGRSRP